MKTALRTRSPLLLTVLMLCLPAIVNSAEPSPYRVVYRATSSGMSATADRYLQRQQDQQMLLVTEMEVKIAGIRIGRAQERSVFLWQNEELLPLSYEYEQTGISGQSESVVFDWQTSNALSKEDDESWNLPLNRGVTDKLSYQFLLSQQLQEAMKEEYQFNVIDTDEIENHLYHITGTEVIETGAGRLNTVKIERIRAPESTRQTIYWLARDWEMLLVKLVQVSSSGSETQLILDHGQLADTPITGLPRSP
ncbi:MAG: DUF3108 domain-containing protein [Pseudohongiellaceae bacterium]